MTSTGTGHGAGDRDEPDRSGSVSAVGQRRVLVRGHEQARLAWVTPQEQRRWAEERDPSGWLAIDELALLEHDPPARAADRLAARLALKLLVAEEPAFAGIELSEINVTADQHGRPTLTIGGPTVPRVSISHAGGWGAAGLCWQGLVGVDVEHERPGLERVRRRLLGPGERASDERALLATWVVKEAAAKAFGAGIDLPFAEVGVRLGDEGSAAIQMPGSVARWDRTGVLLGGGRWFDLGGTAVAIVHFSTREQFF